MTAKLNIEVAEMKWKKYLYSTSVITEQDILDERGRELYAEFWRRNDMIRFGQYTRGWELKADSQIGNENRNLFPIPASQIILNPNLTQNPGY